MPYERVELTRREWINPRAYCNGDIGDEKSWMVLGKVVVDAGGKDAVAAIEDYEGDDDNGKSRD